MLAMDVGIDLGTSHIKVYIKGKGIVLSEANAISYDSYTDEMIAIGNSAKSMLERTPETIELVMPIKSGVIADFSVMQEILKYIIDKICRYHIFRPNVIIGVPSSCTALEKKAVIDAACSSGAGKVSIIDDPVASALGAGVTIDNPHGVMVVDMGAGTSDIAVMTMGTVAVSTSLKVAGDNMNEAICQYLKRERDIIIGIPTAEKIKRTVGCASLDDEELEMAANGKDYITGMPVMFTVTSSEIYLALRESIEVIMEEMRNVLEQTPPEMYSDICHEGIVLTGGASKLRGIDKAMSERFKIKVTVAADGENCAAKGAGYALKDMKTLEDNGYLFKIREK
ncbi:MAG: rod shape-determining protein [Faecalibacterium sp.]|nr:rod shape-determining protein [Ruminococcus sp.]MCM1392945.1 rod shape-determining protein [Ruminococcus sp.]MCM1486613.1 rod shape-determining protein [Faecalibacterium sp.]